MYWNQFKTENDFFNFAEAIRSMTSTEYRIFEYLYKHEAFQGNYRELAEAIGYKEADTPNVRKALIRLNKHYHIVYISYKGGKSARQEELEAKENLTSTEFKELQELEESYPVKGARLKLCFLVDGWQMLLTNK